VYRPLQVKQASEDDPIILDGSLFSVDQWMHGLGVKGGLEVSACSPECSREPKTNVIKGLSFKSFRQMVKRRQFPVAKKLDKCQVCLKSTTLNLTFFIFQPFDPQAFLSICL